MARPELYRAAGLVHRRQSGAYRFELAVPELAIRRGERVALVGASGSGKSTLLDLLALALAPDEAEGFDFAPGDEAIDLAALWHRRARELDALRGRHVGYVLQTGGLLPFLSVRQNIALPGRLQGESAEVEALAERLGLADQLAKKPAALSVGQRQRVAIARALAHRPAVVLADEPTAAVDPTQAEEVMDLLVEHTARSGATLVVASHDHDLVAARKLAIVGFRVERDATGARSVASRA
jgi:putative ABC transport system ATP-binding protein